MSAAWPLFWFVSTALCAVASAWFFMMAWMTGDRLLVVPAGLAFVTFSFFALVNGWRLL